MSSSSLIQPELLPQVDETTNSVAVCMYAVTCNLTTGSQIDLKLTKQFATHFFLEGTFNFFPMGFKGITES
jgi:hypothetical protein